MRVQILRGDCRAVLQTLPESSVDSIVTDPPYELGFMGRGWDSTGVANDVRTWAEALRVLKPGGHLLAFGGTRTYHRMVCAIEDAGFEIRDQIGWAYGSGFPKSHNGAWGGTALKPAWEPIVVARKPPIGTVEANWLVYGTGALNVDGCRVPMSEKWGASGEQTGGKSVHDYGDGLNNSGRSGAHALGRWPANIIHDGSDEVLALFPESKSGRETQPRGTGGIRSEESNTPCGPQYGDAGSAARFFYCAKASKRDRGEGNSHPTVKPTDLMRYLCRLVTPPGGVVLDPFMGSGSTGKAAALEGFGFIGVELSEEYIALARQRIDAALTRDLI